MMATACSDFVFNPAVTRREFLRAGTLSLFGLSLPQLLQAQNPRSQLLSPGGRGESRRGRARACILLFMWGGPAQQDTWDMKPAAPAEVRGLFNPIATRVPDVRICEHFPLLAQRPDKLAIVRSMTPNHVDHTVATPFVSPGL